MNLNSVENWKYFYKMHDNHYTTTNVLYTPLVDASGTIMCMDWNVKSSYHEENKNRSDELIDFFFQREVKYLSLVEGNNWVPTILHIDLNKKRIFLEWNQKTLNTILFVEKKNLNEVCPTWKDQIFNILKDLKYLGLYKLALYPHCFFLDSTNQVKTFDFYGCVEIANPYIERKLIEGVIGPDSGGRFNSATVDGMIDFSVFYKNTLNSHLGKTWPDNPFPEFYKVLYD